METYVTPTGQTGPLNRKAINVLVYGEDEGVIFHALEVKQPYDRATIWHGSAPDMTGVIIFDRQHLITEIANRINRGAIRIYIADNQLWLDDMGNTWYGPTYLAPNEYLPLLIPE